MHLTDFGKKLFIIIGISVLASGIPMVWICPVVTIIIGALFSAFIISTVVLDSYCRKLIEKGNKETEEFAEKNNYKIQKVSPDAYRHLMTHGSGDLGNNLLVNKEEIKFL